jgi:hypothetical protein
MMPKQPLQAERVKTTLVQLRINTKGPNKMLNQTRNKRGLVFIFGLCARWCMVVVQPIKRRNIK